VSQIVDFVKAILLAHYLRLCWLWCVRSGFSLLYNQFAFTYDAISWLVSLGAWRKWQQSALPFVRGPRVLEIAHGPGHMLLELTDRGFQVTGIDLSMQMGRLAKGHASRAGVDISILRGLAQELPFSASSFDSVLTTFPAPFILQRSTLTAVHKVLSLNGLFVIVPEARLTGSGLAERVIEVLYYTTGQRRIPDHPTRIETNEKGNRWQHLDAIFHEAGFLLKHETLSLIDSEVKILVAQKIEMGVDFVKPG